MKTMAGRVAALERQIHGKTITCVMADGSVRHVRGKRLKDMFFEVTHNIIREDTLAVLECIADNCTQIGCGHMTNLIRVMWVGRQRVAMLTPEEAARLDACEPLTPGVYPGQELGGN
jgi:hypothetical protein